MGACGWDRAEVRSSGKGAKGRLGHAKGRGLSSSPQPRTWRKKGLGRPREAQSGQRTARAGVRKWRKGIVQCIHTALLSRKGQLQGVDSPERHWRCIACVRPAAAAFKALLQNAKGKGVHWLRALIQPPPKVCLAWQLRPSSAKRGIRFAFLSRGQIIDSMNQRCITSSVEAHHEGTPTPTVAHPHGIHAHRTHPHRTSNRVPIMRFGSPTPRARSIEFNGSLKPTAACHHEEHDDTH